MDRYESRGMCDSSLSCIGIKVAREGGWEGGRERRRDGGKGPTQEEDLESHPRPAFPTVGLGVGREGGTAWHRIRVIVGCFEKIGNVHDGGGGPAVDEHDEVCNKEGFSGFVKEDDLVGRPDADARGLKEELLDFVCPRHGFPAPARTIVVCEVAIDAKGRGKVDWPGPQPRTYPHFRFRVRPCKAADKDLVFKGCGG